MKRFRVLTVMAIVGLALGGCANQASPSPEPRDAAATLDATQSQAHEECEDEAIVEHAFSGSDDSDLVGFSDNIFVGRVEKRVGSSGARPGRPFGGTRLRVEVLDNVKGRLEGAVTVAQEGSREPERGCPRLAEGDPPLEPGQEVMLFTRREEKRGWHQTDPLR
jgi:hypothetical protein